MILNTNILANYLKKIFFVFFIIFCNSVFSQERNIGQNIPYESQNDSLDLSNNFYDLYTYLGMNHPSEMVYSHWSTDRVKYIDASANLEFDSVYLQLADISSEKNYCHPIKSPITSRFGMRHRRFHYGIDLDLNTGDTVRCAFNGQVRVTHYDPGYGYVIVVRHDNGLETVYAHLSKFLTDTNEVVKAGDVIGLGGNTGRSRGSHLHFELRYLGVALNPETIIDFENFC
jgi:murein DD-endopeptidase MepM/ murein hydrolase activator NlpD